MTSRLKCPFCGEELEPTYGYGVGLYSCPNLTCKGPHGYAEDSVWQALIHTKKQLDRAKWYLKEIVENHRYTPITTAEMALKELDDGNL